MNQHKNAPQQHALTTKGLILASQSYIASRDTDAPSEDFEHWFLRMGLKIDAYTVKYGLARLSFAARFSFELNEQGEAFVTEMLKRLGTNDEALRCPETPGRVLFDADSGFYVPLGAQKAEAGSSVEYDRIRVSANEVTVFYVGKHDDESILFLP